MAVSFMTRASSLHYREAISILENPENFHINTCPPVKPKGGELFIVSSDNNDLRLKDWMCDQYKWKHYNGITPWPPRSKDPQIKKAYHKMSRDKSSTFQRHGWWLVSNPHIVLVHYIGDETEYVPSPHGNSKTNTIEYVRTCPSVLKQASEKNKTQPSIKTFLQLATTPCEPELNAVLRPRNLRQVQNAAHNEQHSGHFSVSNKGIKMKVSSMPSSKLLSARAVYKATGQIPMKKKQTLLKKKDRYMAVEQMERIMEDPSLLNDTKAGLNKLKHLKMRKKNLPSPKRNSKAKKKMKQVNGLPKANGSPRQVKKDIVHGDAPGLGAKAKAPKNTTVDKPIVNGTGIIEKGAQNTKKKTKVMKETKSKNAEAALRTLKTGDKKVNKKKNGKKKLTKQKEKIVELVPINPSADDSLIDFEPVPGDEIGAVMTHDTREKGKESFLWIIHPHTEDEFFRNYWEKKPLLVKRNDSKYFGGIFSAEALDKILRQQMVVFSKNIDITSYSNGKRETHNPIGQAHAPVVWDYYNNGCSVRMLNPQTFHRPVWKLLATLQEYFNSFCGANVYLTPPDTQGFAPHWDDIEAFILQLEGKKRWRVYAPRCDEETLPVNSSENLNQDEIGEPILDTVLEPGDLLYFPRGFIHQGHTVGDEHSLHITLSTYQKNSWGHFFEKLLPKALKRAMEDDIEFRRGLPRDYLNCMGIVNMDREFPGRNSFIEKVTSMVERFMSYAPIDSAVDEHGASFIHDCLPPVLTEEDKNCSVFGGGERWCSKEKKILNRVEMDPDTHIRLIRGNCARLVVEEDKVKLYHTLENSREYHQEEPQYLEIDSDGAPAVEALLLAYPNYLTIDSLPLKDKTSKMVLACGLWERGLLVTANPLESQYD